METTTFRKPFWATLTAAVVFGVAAMPGAADASVITFVTPTGATTSGPVDASATFTTTTGAVDISLTDLLANPSNVGQLISDLAFTLSNGATTGSLTSSNAASTISVHAGGTTTPGSSNVSTGWALNNNVGEGLRLNVLGTPTAPKMLIIGPPGPGGLYSNANPSIAGNVPHNPFINNTATFVVAVTGVTASTTITSATFSFGTTPDSKVPGIVPLPAALPLFATGLGALGLIGWRRKRKSARREV